MVVEYSGLIRLSVPPSRSSGFEELGSSGKDFMVRSEALLIGLFPNEDIESLGEVVVKTLSGQSDRVKRSRGFMEPLTFFASQVVGRSYQPLLLLTGCPLSWCRVACCVRAASFSGTVI